MCAQQRQAAEDKPAGGRGEHLHWQRIKMRNDEDVAFSAKFAFGEQARSTRVRGLSPLASRPLSHYLLWANDELPSRRAVWPHAMSQCQCNVQCPTILSVL